MNDTQKQNNQAVCPECDTPLLINDTIRVGEIVECSACATECECLSLAPLTFAPIEQEK
jgi:hypothetical protein